MDSWSHDSLSDAEFYDWPLLGALVVGLNISYLTETSTLLQHAYYTFWGTPVRVLAALCSNDIKVQDHYLRTYTTTYHDNARG